MKKFWSICIVCMIMLISSILVLCSKPEAVYADYSGVSGANFVLTGYNGSAPVDYFYDSNNNPTISNSISKNPDKKYINSKGEESTKYRFLTGDTDSWGKVQSSGSAAVIPTSEMKDIISTGEMTVQLSCGILAMEDDKRAKVIVVIEVIAGGKSVQKQEFTSNKVSSNSAIYEPEWISSNKLSLPANTDKVIFSFKNCEDSTVFHQAKFCIFEPTLIFSTNLSFVTLQTENQSVEQGQVLKLNAFNNITNNKSTTEYFSYYKKIHAISFRVTEGATYAKVVGNYLYIDSEAPDGATIKVQAYCRQSSTSANVIYSNEKTFKINKKYLNIAVSTSFSNPATITGEGRYFVGETATLKIKENTNFTFLHWEVNGIVKGSSTTLTYLVEENNTIRAIFYKSVSIKNIVVKSKVYDGTKSAVIEKVEIDGAEAGHDVYVSGLTARFSTTSAGQNKSVTALGTPSLTGNDSQLYRLKNSAMPVSKATISPANATIRCFSKTKVYGQNDPELTYTVEGLIGGESLIGGPNREEGENVGNYKIGIDNIIRDNPNYTFTCFEGQFTISKRTLTIQNINVEDKVYNGSTDANVIFILSNIMPLDEVKLVATAVFSSSSVGSSKIVQLSNYKLEGKDADNYIIIPNTNYSLGNIVTKDIYIGVTNQSCIYGQTYVIQYETVGLINNDELSGGLDIIGDWVAGRHKIALGTLSNNNYSLHVTESYLEIFPKQIEVKANSIEKTYGDDEKELTYVVEGLVGEDVLFGKLVRTPGENVGSYPISIGTLSNPNYSIQYTGSNYVIKNRLLTVDFICADKNYDGTTNITYSYELLNRYDSDDVDIVCELKYGNADVGENKTVYVNSIELVGSVKGNYDLTVNDSSLVSSISAKTVIINTQNYHKSYGETDPTFVTTMAGVVNGESIVGRLVRQTGENIGKYQITIPQSMIEQNKNYNLVLGESKELEIVRKIIDVEVVSKEKRFGDSDPDIAVVVDLLGFAFEETYEQLRVGELNRQSGENVGRYKYGIGTFSFGDNYQINFEESGYLTIRKREIDVRINNCEKIYGENDPIFDYTTFNCIDGVNPSMTLRRENGEDVGEYVISYQSIDDSHYTINFITGLLTIKARKIKIKPNSSYKFYGEEDPLIDYSLIEGFTCFDETLDMILSGEPSREEGENVGTYSITQGSVDSGENYELLFEDGEMVIVAQSIEITFDDVEKFYGDSDPEFTYSITSGAIRNGDGFTGSAYRTEGENIGKYSIDSGTMAIGANYNFTVVFGELTIVAREIEITANSAQKIYGEIDPAFSYSVTKGSILDIRDLSGGLYRENPGEKLFENVGSYPILSSFNNSNYAITYIGADLSINQRVVSIKGNNYESVYGEPLIEEYEYIITDGTIVDGDVIRGGLYKIFGLDAGEYDIRSELSLGRNYKIKYTAGKYTIKPVELIVSVGENTKVYGTGDGPYTLNIISGALIDGEELDYIIKREQGENVGEYLLTLVSLDKNYNLTTEDSILNIAKKDVNLHIQVLDKAFDGTDYCRISHPVVSGLLDNEIVLDYDSDNCARFITSQPGNDIPVVLNGFTLIGAKAINYNLLLPTDLKADITISNMASENVSISTTLSTAIKQGSSFKVENISVDENAFNGKKVAASFNVSLLDANGKTLILDRAINLSVDMGNIRKFNNLIVYARNEKGKLESVAYKIEGNNIILSASSFSDFVIVCDNESWIDIAVAVCIGLMLGAGLTVYITRYKKKKTK